MEKHRTAWTKFGLGVLLVGLFVAPLHAQEVATPPRVDWEEYADSRPFPSSRITIPKWRLTNGPHVRSAFREVVAEARLATVRVRSDGRDVALGGIVGAQGWVLTKASQLEGELTCQLADQREYVAEVIAKDRDFDLALLRIDAEQLPRLKLKPLPNLEIGAWLATIGMKRGPQAIGVLSVEPREIVHRAGTLGVRLHDQTAPAKLVEVFPHTGAEEAGLLTDDIVLSINGQATPSRESFVRRVRDFSPGDRLRLKVQRGDETLDIRVLLRGRRPWRLQSREEFQNELGSQLSRRRFGFPQVFQHDAVVKPTDCGGPVVDLDGQVVGFNIARAGRTETYAIPTDVVLERIEHLKRLAVQ